MVSRLHMLLHTHTYSQTHTYTLAIKFIYFILTSLMCSQMLPSCQVLHSISLRAQSFPLQVMGRGGKEMTSFLRVCHRHTSKIWSIRIATVKAKPLWVRECHHQLSDHRRKPALPLRNSALTKANLSSDMSSPHPKTVILGHILWNVVVYSIGFFFFLLEENCFTMLCWFLPYIIMSQPQVYICLLPLETPLISFATPPL